ncbi:MAG: carboxypeptidase-like regulatory domain-containing protein, partial [Ilumatobacteraceae bacterium]
MKLELAQTSIDLAPGQQATLNIRVENDGPDPLTVALGITGLDAAGMRPVADLGVLAPGAAAATTLHFALPVEAAAGVRSVAILAEGRRTNLRRDLPPNSGIVRQTANLTVRVGSVSHISLRLAQTEVRGRFRGRLRADLRNLGVEPVTLHLWGKGDDVAVRFERPVLTLPPGHSAQVRGIVRKPGTTLRREHRRPFVVTAQGASTPATTTGTFVQRGLLPRSLLVVVAVVAVLALWIGGLMVTNNKLRDQPAAGASTSTTTSTTAPGSGANGTGNGAATPGAGQGAPGSGTPGAPGSGVPGGKPNGGVEQTPAGTKLPVSLIGTVDGPAKKVGTEAVLEVISLGGSAPTNGAPAKLAAFTSVRHATAPVSPTQKTATDDTGRFRFDDILDSPALFRLTVYRPGFDVYSQVVNIDGTVPNVDVSIKLAPAAGVLAGRVVDLSGAAIGGATIAVSSGDLKYSTVSDDATGAWRLDGVATPGTYVVRVTKDAYASASLIATLDGGGSATGLNATLSQGVGTLHALVQSRSVGTGGLTVTLSDGTRSFSTTTRTDAPAGLFEFPGVPFGVYSLQISGDGWQSSARQVTVGAGDVDLGVIGDLARSTATMSGIVLQQVVTVSNADGSSSTCVFPADTSDPGIRLQACGGVGVTATSGDKTFRTTSSSGDGSFLLAGIPPGTYSMSFERAGYSTVLFTATVMAGDNLDIPETDLSVIPRDSGASGSVKFFVASVANLPLTGITAQVIGQNLAPIPVVSAAPGAGNTQALISNLLPGTYSLRVTADEHDATVVQVQIPLGAQVNAGTVALTPLASIGGQVAGITTSTPVPGAIVFATPDPTDPNVATLLVTPVGTPAAPDATYLATDPATGVVQLCDRNVAPPGSATPDVRRGLCTRTDAGGRYDFTRLMRTGRYAVYAPMNVTVDASSAIALDHTLGSVVVSTTVGVPTSLNLALNRFGAISGTIRTPDAATGTDFVTVDGISVTATFCFPAATPLGCDLAPADPLFQTPRGRVSAGAAGTGTFRVDRLTAPGFDPVTHVTVDKYLVRFHDPANGFEDQYQVVNAPANNVVQQVDAMMLPKPTRVEVTPYWTESGSATLLQLPGATVTVTGIVGYTTTPLNAVTGSATGVPVAPGAGPITYTSSPTTFKAGSVTIKVTAAGYPTTSVIVPLVGPTCGFTIGTDGSGNQVLSGNLLVSATPRSVNGSLSITCCAATVPENHPEMRDLTPTRIADVYAQLQATLTLDADSTGAT